MEKVKIKSQHRRLLADTITPVSLYLTIREHHDVVALLESNDSRSRENSQSIIGFAPLAVLTVQHDQLVLEVNDEVFYRERLTKPMQVAKSFQRIIEAFEIEETEGVGPTTGFVGHTCYDGVKYFDTMHLDITQRHLDIPDIHYVFFRYYVTIDHHHGVLHLTENRLSAEPSDIEGAAALLQKQNEPRSDFKLVDDEESNLTDQEFLDLVEKGKHHCRIGDVFQIVLSRRYQQKFSGDEFNVYRVLRSINPSPYLYFFNFGGYKIFGSSPEAQLIIRDGRARLNPIAGTYRRTGDDDQDRASAKELAEDPKEVAEHIMLVDLARNDLGRHGQEVSVEEFKEIQYFSHVIHLVSKVEADLPDEHVPMEIFGDTFPAGTLSGAPKYKAIELIDRYENSGRSFYGGALGFIDLNGNMNQAIVIRSFLSIEQTLISQAGAGIVSESVAESELQEVNNKLGALKKALQMAEKI